MNKWHKYPDEKPQERQVCWVTLGKFVNVPYPVVEVDIFEDNLFGWSFHSNVIAWMPIDIPEAYVEEESDEIQNAQTP